MRTESSTILTQWITAAEFVNATPRQLGKNSFVLLMSHRKYTKKVEVIDAVSDLGFDALDPRVAGFFAPMSFLT